MKKGLDISPQFTLEDIRKIRDDVARRFTREDGSIDWAGAVKDAEAGANRVRAEIARLRASSKAV